MPTTTLKVLDGFRLAAGFAPMLAIRLPALAVEAAALQGYAHLSYTVVEQDTEKHHAPAYRRVSPGGSLPGWCPIPFP